MGAFRACACTRLILWFVHAKIIKFNGNVSQFIHLFLSNGTSRFVNAAMLGAQVDQMAVLRTQQVLDEWNYLALGDAACNEADSVRGVGSAYFDDRIQAQPTLTFLRVLRLMTEASFYRRLLIKNSHEPHSMFAVTVMTFGTPSEWWTQRRWRVCNIFLFCECISVSFRARARPGLIQCNIRKWPKLHWDNNVQLQLWQTHSLLALASIGQYGLVIQWTQIRVRYLLLQQRSLHSTRRKQRRRQMQSANAWNNDEMLPLKIDTRH